MANVWAIKSGDWSDPTVWNTGALPTSSDDVYTNTFSINVNQTINVVSLRNGGTTGITAGGTFVFNTGDIIANISNNIILSTGTICSITAASGTITLNVIAGILLANVFGATFFNYTGNCNLTINAVSLKGKNADGNLLFKSSLGILTINGNVDSSGAGAAKSISLNSNSKTIINGDVIGSLSTSLGTPAIIFGNGELVINGNVPGAAAANPTGGSLQVTGGVVTVTGTVTGASSAGISISGGTVNVIGNILGGYTEGVTGVFVSGSGILNHIGTAQASSSASAIACDSPKTSVVISTGPFIKNGYIVAIASQILRINFGANSYFQFKKSNGEDIDYVSTVEGYNYPTASDVRDGVVYKSGLVTGTLKVPNPADVRKSIPTDNTVGTADITPEDFITALENSTSDIAVRLRNCATVESTGAQIASYE